MMNARDKRRLRFALRVLALVPFVHISSAVADPLYVLRGSRGVITFTSQKPSSGNFQVFESNRGGSFSFYRMRGRFRPRPRTTEFDQLIHQTAVEHSVDPALVKAVVHVESAFDPDATSYKGAMGLMQLMPGTARRFGVRNAYHPDENIQGGVKYLRLLTDRYNGNLRLALAAYNAGEGVVDRIQEVPPYSETQDYVRKVLSTVSMYRCAAEGRKDC